MFTSSTYDVIVIGARCAGAATAMLLARHGARVLLVDRASPGSDTMSTHALMRGAVLLLERWGLAEDLRAAGTPQIRRTSFIYGDTALDIDIRPEDGVAALMAPRRHLLDSVLAGAADRAGAQVRFETSCVGLLFDTQGRVRGARLRGADGAEQDVSAALVIGADGKRSQVARAVRASVTRHARNSVACAYQYVTGVPQRGYRWHFNLGAAGGLIPTNEGRSCAFVALPQAEVSALRGGTLPVLAERHLPQLAGDMAGARTAGRPVIFSGMPGYLRQCAGPGWALVGDASWFRDPITAHGITDAFRDAELLVGAVVAGRLDTYEAQRDRLSAPIFALSDRIAGFSWSLEQLGELHQQLNRAMKANQAWIAGRREAWSAAA